VWVAVLVEKPEDWTSDDWSTPVELVRDLEEEFGRFQMDPCCRPETAKADKFYTRADDGLSKPWIGRVWMNPPYSDPGKWLRKAIEEVGRKADLVVALIPAATDTRWFHNHVLGVATEVRFIKGRIKFIGWMGTPIGSPKTGSVLAVYRAGPAGLVSPEEWAERCR
jgi:phage N-6-adenine-methyltransferase